MYKIKAGLTPPGRRDFLPIGLHMELPRKYHVKNIDVLIKSFCWMFTDKLYIDLLAIMCPFKRTIDRLCFLLIDDDHFPFHFKLK